MSILNLQKPFTLTNFQEGDPDWIIVNDGVMGGLSESSIVIQKNGIATFAGELSLKNYGGFASTRMLVKNQLPTGYRAINLRIKGDGNKYNFRIRKNRQLDGLAYDAEFTTLKEEWITIQLPLSEFQGTFRGEKYEDKIGILSEEIGQIVILIANKQEGGFKIEMDWINLIK